MPQPNQHTIYEGPVGATLVARTSPELLCAPMTSTWGAAHSGGTQNHDQRAAHAGTRCSQCFCGHPSSGSSGCATKHLGWIERGMGAQE